MWFVRLKISISIHFIEYSIHVVSPSSDIREDKIKMTKGMCRTDVEKSYWTRDSVKKLQKRAAPAHSNTAQERHYIDAACGAKRPYNWNGTGTETDLQSFLTFTCLILQRECPVWYSVVLLEEIQASQQGDY